MQNAIILDMSISSEIAFIHQIEVIFGVLKLLEPSKAMARIPGLINGAESTAYQVMSRSALDGYPLANVEKEQHP